MKKYNEKVVSSLLFGCVSWTILMSNLLELQGAERVYGACPRSRQVSISIVVVLDFDDDTVLLLAVELDAHPSSC